MANDLLDPTFLRELEVLRRHLEIRARSGAAGERLASRRGSSVEFQEHRPYVPGDDPRRIDWMAYARSGEPVIKLFRAEEDVVVRLLVDRSASMGFGEPSKLCIARRLAAAVGYLALARLERAQLIEAAPERTLVRPPVRGRASLPELLRSLGALEAQGAVDLTRAIDGTVRQGGRPGLMVVCSDFFDGGPVLGALGRARAAGHDVVLFQVVSPEEQAPMLEGDLLLEDAETGETVELTADADALEAYVRRFAGLCEELRAFARRHGATYVRVVVGEPLEEAIRRMVNRSCDGGLS
ncbi:MAG: DUF58 domain-containing protein [Myxococcales bacterium]|nr:DUF58 domain-containing protein [Polyangiaceae bacterium]MDW8250637.1 DUF58 domain-containing protein [Myxococcales bacterium]